LANNASKPQGAQALSQALTKDHNGSLLNNVATFLKDPAVVNGIGILGHVLGSQQPAITQALAKSTGMDPAQVAQVLQIAAPLVMAAVGREQQQQSLDPGGLANYLGGQQQAAQQSNPDLMGALNTLLDTNKDGSALDEVAGLLGSLLGGGTSGQA
jgi:hypothetical protein